MAISGLLADLGLNLTTSLGRTALVPVSALDTGEHRELQGQLVQANSAKLSGPQSD